VAPSNTTVLLLGESGTGKELVAKAIHDTSPRADKPFVPLDCSGLSETLFESQFFGHEKGAFTGAQQRHIGLVEAAHGGTLFLDELGDIPLSLQVKLLRLLETGTFLRVGRTEPIKAEFRLICATHRDLKQHVEDGHFRRDLYYRINALPNHSPPLRERQDDLPLLIETLLQRFEPQRKVTHSREAMDCLINYPFPGNIRELRNFLERTLLLADDQTIQPEHLPPECGCTTSESRYPAPNLSSPDEVLPLKIVEQTYLQWISARYPGDKRSLARQLGLSERTLYRKLSGDSLNKKTSYKSSQNNCFRLISPRWERLSRRYSRLERRSHSAWHCRSTLWDSFAITHCTQDIPTLANTQRYLLNPFLTWPGFHALTSPPPTWYSVSRVSKKFFSLRIWNIGVFRTCNRKATGLPFALSDFFTPSQPPSPQILYLADKSRIIFFGSDFALLVMKRIIHFNNTTLRQTKGRFHEKTAQYWPYYIRLVCISNPGSVTHRSKRCAKLARRHRWHLRQPLFWQ